MTPDDQLLRRYALAGDEAAFTELVHRYVDLVYSAALRLLNGDAHLAQDVSQRVFTDLSRKAWKLSGRATLSGWLHTSARYAAAKIRRTEGRRRAREQEAYIMQDHSTTPEIPWEQLRPLLDEAVGRLRERDRDAVVLRYFQGKSHREVGAALGVNEDAARKRVERALEILRTHFARQGVTISAALLVAAIGANSVQAAPTGLAATLSGAVAATGQAGVISTFLKTLYMTTTTKTSLMAAVFLAAAAIPLFFQHREIAQLREQLAGLQRSGARSGRGQNPAISQAAAAPRRLTPEEILAKITALKKQGWNWEKEWQTFVDSLNPADIAVVAAGLNQQLPNPEQRLSFLKPLLALWAKSDPSAALAYIDESQPGGLRDVEVEALLAGWTEQDPEAAAAWWRQLPDSRLRTDSAKTVIDALAGKNPAAAYEFAIGASAKLQSALIPDVFASWARTDPAAAVAQATQMEPSDLRGQAFYSVAKVWAENDPQAAQAWAESLPEGPYKTTALSMTIQGLAQANPKAATDYVLNLPPGQERDDSIGFLSRTLAENDPNAAWTMAQQLPDDKARQNALNAIIGQYALTDPAAALTFMEEQGTSLSPANAKSLYSSIAANLAGNAPQAAIAAAANLPDGPNRDTYLSTAFSALVATSPTDAEKLISSLPTDKQAAAVNRVASSMSFNSNPSGAMALVMSQPEGVITDSTFDSVFRNWTGSAPEAAGQWIKTLPAGATQDNALQIYVSALTKPSPATAAAWAEAISDESTRNTAIEKVAQSWLKTDPKAATAWLAQSSLPADRQQVLLNPGN